MEWEARGDRQRTWRTVEGDGMPRDSRADSEDGGEDLDDGGGYWDDGGGEWDV